MITSRPESLRELEHEVGVLIRRIKRVIGERARAVHPELQPASYLLVAYLAEHGPMRSAAIAGVFDIDKGAISRQVQHLVELGLVDRTPDPDDGRATLVSASEAAVRRLAEVTSERRAWLDERLADWSDEDLGTLVGALGRYNQALD
ncbi:MAG: MarR family winged helix-turn-helix transcriptional regulator [Nocardioides sp.]